MAFIAFLFNVAFFANQLSFLPLFLLYYLFRVTKCVFFFQGLVVSKHKAESDNEVAASIDSPPSDNNNIRVVEEMCPVCQEILQNQKMVFQCGHLTCCKCKSFFLIIYVG